MEWELRADGVWAYGDLEQPFPPPAVSGVGAHYDEVTRRSRRRRRDDDDELFAVRAHHNWCVASEIMESAERVGPLRVLDLAGGKGGSIAKLQRAGRVESLTLLDVSAEACSAARERLREARVDANVYCVDVLEEGVVRRVGEMHGPFNLVLLNFAANYLCGDAARFARLLADVRTACSADAQLNVAWLLSTSLRAEMRVATRARRLWSAEERGAGRYAFALGDSVLGCEECELDFATLEGAAGAAGFYTVGAVLSLAAYPRNAARPAFIAREQGAASADVSKLYACARFAAIE